jgi:Tetracyclin repressor-like, C-terminal domain
MTRSPRRGTRSGGAGARPHRHITAITERLAAAFALAVDAGELDAAPDTELAAAQLIGPLVYRTTLQAAPVPAQLLTAVVDAVTPRQQPGQAPAPAATAQAG